MNHFYIDPSNGKEYGPFTDQERAELGAMARRPLRWREVGTPSCVDELNDSLKED
jgi:hypothetical protein